MARALHSALLRAAMSRLASSRFSRASSLRCSCLSARRSANAASKSASSNFSSMLMGTFPGEVNGDNAAMLANDCASIPPPDRTGLMGCLPGDKGAAEVGEQLDERAEGVEMTVVSRRCAVAPAPVSCSPAGSLESSTLAGPATVAFCGVAGMTGVSTPFFAAFSRDRITTASSSEMARGSVCMMRIICRQAV